MKTNAPYLVVMLCSLLLSSAAGAQQPAPDSSEVERTLRCSGSSPGLHIQDGDSFNELARRVAPPALIAFEDWQHALVECNPQAFPSGDPNFLLAGSVLRLPDFEATAPAVVAEPIVAPVVVEPAPVVATPGITTAPGARAPHKALLALTGLTLLCVLALLGLSVFRVMRERGVTAALPETSQQTHATPHSSASRSEAEGIGDQVAKSVERLLQGGAETDAKITNLQKTFMTLQNALDEKDAEIRRFKKGYDVHLLKKFVLRFVRVDQAVDDFKQDEIPSAEALDVIKSVLEDALAECDVEKFSPPIGADYRTTEGLADNPKIQTSDNPKDKFKIAEVLQSGYRIKLPKGYEVVYPAKVRIFTN